MPCHAWPCSATPMPRHVLPRPCQTLPHHYHTLPCYADAMPRRARPCHAVARRATPCHALPRPATPCHALATPFHAVVRPATPLPRRVTPLPHPCHVLPRRAHAPQACPICMCTYCNTYACASGSPPANRHSPSCTHEVLCVCKSKGTATVRSALWGAAVVSYHVRQHWPKMRHFWCHSQSSACV